MDEKNAHSQSLSVLSEFFVESAYNPVDWQHSFTEDNEIHSFWLTKGKISNLQIHLTRIPYQFVYSPLVPLKASGVDNIKDLNNNNIRHSNEKLDINVGSFYKKEILSPVQMDIFQSCSLMTSATAVLQIMVKFEFYIHEVDAIVYLNLSSFLQLYKNTCTPFIDLYNSKNASREFEYQLITTSPPPPAAANSDRETTTTTAANANATSSQSLEKIDPNSLDLKFPENLFELFPLIRYQNNNNNNNNNNNMQLYIYK